MIHRAWRYSIERNANFETIIKKKKIRIDIKILILNHYGLKPFNR